MIREAGIRVRRGLRVLVVAASGVIAGCAQAPVPADFHYRLVVPRAADLPAARRLDGVLLVKRFTADGLLGQRALAYSRVASPQVLQQYNYRFWTDPPTLLLQQLAVDVLRAMDVAPRVVTPQHGVDARYTLNGRILRLEHLVGAEPAVAVSLELSLFDNRERRLVLLESYAERRPVAGPGIAEAAVEINAAAVRVLTRFVSDLAALPVNPG